MSTKNRFRWIAAAAAALIVLAITLAHLLPSRGTEARLAALRAQGIPVTLAELDEFYTRVPAAENAALLVLDAAKARVQSGTNADPERVQGRARDAGVLLPPDVLEAAEALVRSNSSTLNQLHAAAKLKSSRYPIDLTAGANTLLPHLTEVKSMVQLLKWEALVHSARGEREQAVQSIHTGFAIAQTLRNEPVFISELVRIACASITLKAVEGVMSSHQLTGAQLEQLSKTFDEVESDGRRGMERAFCGERAMGVSFFNMDYRQVAQLLSLTSGSTNLQGIGGMIGFSVYSATGLRDIDFSTYIRLVDAFASAVTNPYPQYVARSREAEAELSETLSHAPGRFAILTRMLLPSLSRAALKEATLAANLRCARTAAAVEKYRLDHQGALPALLADLLPKYLDELPLDPFDGHPLEFRPEADGRYLVISPGATAERNSSVKGATNLVAFTVARNSARSAGQRRLEQ